MGKQHRPLVAEAAQQALPIEPISTRPQQMSDVRPVKTLALHDKRLGPDHFLRRAEANGDTQNVGFNGVPTLEELRQLMQLRREINDLYTQNNAQPATQPQQQP